MVLPQIVQHEKVCSLPDTLGCLKMLKHHKFLSCDMVIYILYIILYIILYTYYIYMYIYNIIHILYIYICIYIILKIYTYTYVQTKFTSNRVRYSLRNQHTITLQVNLTPKRRCFFSHFTLGETPTWSTETQYET